MKALREYHWELTLCILIVAAVAWAASLSPFYLEPDQIAY